MHSTLQGAASTSSNTRASSTVPQQQRQPVNTQTKILNTIQGRILCIADIRGHLSQLNKLASDTNAMAIIHTGDFGFCDSTSVERINDRTLRHLVMYSPLIGGQQRERMLSPETTPEAMRNIVTTSPTPLLSEFAQLLSGELKFDVPVFTIYGACEDVAVIEKLRAGVYSINNLHLLDEATTVCVDIGGVKLRLLGLGGAFVPHKIFDNGDGQATIAGAQGTMWTTALQIGELVDTAQRVFDQSEVRLLVSHAAPGREGIMSQLALAVRADLTISAGLHFRYPISYNDFSVQSDFEGYRAKLLNGKESFDRIWDAVKTQVDQVIDANQKLLMEKALSVVERIPAVGAGNDENFWKNCWNWNLTDAAYGHLILDIKEGRVNAEMKSQGFNYAYRRQSSPTTASHPTGGAGTPSVVDRNTSAGQSPAVNAGPSLANGRGLTSKAPTPAPNTPGTHTPAVVNPPNAAPQSAQPPPKPATPVPTDTPQTNGTSAGGATELSKKERKKLKEKEKKAAAAAASASGAPGTTTTDKKDATGPVKKANGASIDITSDGGVPGSPNAESPATGSQTPLGARKNSQRNPWTLFLKHLPVPVTEEEIREFFGDAMSGITFVKIPFNTPGKTQRHIAYVEFGDEEAMKNGLSKKAEKIRDATPHVSIAEDREAPTGPGSVRGRGAGRGGFAARGLMAAGLGGGRGAPRQE